MNVLVTGGAGFIGGHMAARHLADGHRVVVVDNLSTGAREKIPDGARFVAQAFSGANLDNAALPGKIAQGALENSNVNSVTEMVALCKPDNGYWCNGSQEEYDRLCAEMVAAATYMAFWFPRVPAIVWVAIAFWPARVAARSRRSCTRRWRTSGSTSS